MVQMIKTLYWRSICNCNKRYCGSLSAKQIFLILAWRIHDFIEVQNVIKRMAHVYSHSIRSMHFNANGLKDDVLE